MIERVQSTSLKSRQVKRVWGSLSGTDDYIHARMERFRLIRSILIASSNTANVAILPCVMTSTDDFEWLLIAFASATANETYSNRLNGLFKPCCSSPLSFEPVTAPSASSSIVRTTHKSIRELANQSLVYSSESVISQCPLTVRDLAVPSNRYLMLSSLNSRSRLSSVHHHPEGKQPCHM